MSPLVFAFLCLLRFSSHGRGRFIQIGAPPLLLQTAFRRRLATGDFTERVRRLADTLYADRVVPRAYGAPAHVPYAEYPAYVDPLSEARFNIYPGPGALLFAHVDDGTLAQPPNADVPLAPTPPGHSVINTIANVNTGWTPLTSSTTSAEADVPQLSGGRAVVGATWSQPPKGGWYQRDQLTFSSILLRYLVCPKFSDPNLLRWFYSLLKLDAPYLILLTIITRLMVCGDIESKPGPSLGNDQIPNAPPNGIRRIFGGPIRGN